MAFLFDTANLANIKKYIEYFPIEGVTSNPTIVKAEGKINFFEHMKEIRKIIGRDRSLHVQVVAKDTEGMLQDAYAILENIDDKVFIKIPTTEDGLRAIMKLKSEGIGVTATAIYTTFQGYAAIQAGADYIAAYRNRMESLDINFNEAIKSFRQMIDDNHLQSRILAASFKNIRQVNLAFMAGAHTATVQPELLHKSFQMPMVDQAVDDFAKDWQEIFGDHCIADLEK